MPSMFHDCCGDHGQEPSRFRELLLADCDETEQWACYCRDAEYQAVTTARFPLPPPSTNGECQASEVANVLLRAVGASARGSGQHRYDRIIILQRDPSDEIDGVIQFFRVWMPRVLQEGWLFVTTLPQRLEPTRAAFCEARGRCEQVAGPAPV